MSGLTDQTVANSTLSENESEVDEATSAAPENQAIANVTSTHTPLGLLDLPSELRIMVFRHLLVVSHGENSSFGMWHSSPRPSVNILRTSGLIHREAFEILYGENHFANCLAYSGFLSNRFPRVVDAIQNIRIDVTVLLRYTAIEKFKKLVRCFGNPSRLRNTLTVKLTFADPRARPLKWFIRVLGRFTNFRTVKLYFQDYNDVCEHVSHVREYFKSALEPVLGHAEAFQLSSFGLRFHPIDHWNCLREPEDSDWADSLDGIRLEWNEGEVKADDSGTPALE